MTTRKAIRFCKERNIACQVIDVEKRSLSDGEWRHLFQLADAHDLVDTTSKYYQKEGYEWRSYDAAEELVAHPQLLKTPVIRKKNRLIIGFDAEGILSLEEQA